MDTEVWFTENILMHSHHMVIHLAGGEILFSMSSDTDKLRSSSVSDTGARMRVTLNESDFDNDSSPPTSPSPTEMETDANSGTSTLPQYETVNAPTLRARRVQRRDNMLKSMFKISECK